jgi:hypothetical protein
MSGRSRQFMGLAVVFMIVSLVAFLLKARLADIKTDYRVILGANLLLFILSLVSLVLHARALSKPNPQVFIRSVMLANILKLLGLAAAAFIYISAAGKSTSTNAVFAGLFLYIVYTWVEKRATIRLSKSRKN